MKKDYLYISNLIAKDIQGFINKNELEELQLWLLESTENKAIYNEIKNKDWYASQTRKISAYDIAKDWNTVNSEIGQTQIIPNSKVTRSFVPLYRWAAIFILLFAVGVLINNYFINDFSEQIAQPIIQPGIKGAKLIMDNGNVIPLKADTSFSIKESDGTLIQKMAGKLSYKKTNQIVEQEIFNTIKTEKGEEYTTKLSDGTIVKLNAESEIRFPVSFIKNERVVDIKGEVFFEVAHNKEKPFYVNTKKSKIRVLGTVFNVKAYEDEEEELTTLVDGSINIQHRYDKRSVVELHPGEQSSIITVNRRIKVRMVDADYYTAWTKGKFVFKNERLEDIIIQLKRWYDFEVEYDNKDLKDIRFGARLDRYSDVNKIFKITNNTKLVKIVQNKNKFMIKTNN